MIYRLMVGLRVAGVERILLMPAAGGVGESLRRHLQGNTGTRRQPVPELEVLEMRTRGDAHDTEEAVRLMRERGVSALVVLGGDGTCRVASSHCYDTPLCALSTGTNNAFPRVREATVAGLATGLVAAGKLGNGVLVREKVLRVRLNGALDHDQALVDVAVCRERWIGARALYDPGAVSAIFVASAAPEAIGMSAVAGMLSPVSRENPGGLFVELADPAETDTVLTVPLAPGLVAPVGIAGYRRLEPGEKVKVAPDHGSLALDGEREIELTPGDEAEISLSAGGPLTIDVEECMRRASQEGLLNG